MKKFNKAIIAIIVILLALALTGCKNNALGIPQNIQLNEEHREIYSLVDKGINLVIIEIYFSYKI